MTTQVYKVSVVVPVYNVEQSIVRCAESLFEQTLDEMQFIFVDDASPDQSVSLLEQTLERFPRRKPQTIILHHARNRGLPTARATGLAYVEAPYVAHCDSDDYVEPAMYEKLYNYARQNDSDMVVCGKIVHGIDGKEIPLTDNPDPNQSLILNFLYGRLFACVWLRLTRTDIYRRVRFPTENFFEDWVQTVQLLTYAARISFIPDCLYHYVCNPSSITHDISSDKIADKMQQCIKNYYLMHDFVIAHHPVKERDFLFRKAAIRRRFFPLIKREQYLQTFPELNFSVLLHREIPLSYKVSHILILLGVFPFVRSVYVFVKNNRLLSGKGMQHNAYHPRALLPCQKGFQETTICKCGENEP